MLMTRDEDDDAQPGCWDEDDAELTIDASI
jgi:hypothetical protein